LIVFSDYKRKRGPLLNGEREINARSGRRVFLSTTKKPRISDKIMTSVGSGHGISGAPGTAHGTDSELVRGESSCDGGHLPDDEDSKRRRVTRACDICWKKKIKCLNDSQSACEHCRQNGFTCSYFRDAKRRGPKALNPFEKVFKYLSHLLP
jgi:hypothetical protein